MLSGSHTNKTASSLLEIQAKSRFFFKIRKIRTTQPSETDNVKSLLSLMLLGPLSKAEMDKNFSNLIWESGILGRLKTQASLSCTFPYIYPRSDPSELKASPPEYFEKNVFDVCGLKVYRTLEL